MAQPPAGDPQPLPLRPIAEQDLGDGQTDQLGIAQLGWPTGACAGPEQVIDADVQCDHEGVEVGVHEASQRSTMRSQRRLSAPSSQLSPSQHPFGSNHLVGLCQVCSWRMVCGWMRPPVHQEGAVGGIAPGELAAIRGRLEAFADDIFESLPRKDQRARGECYLRGLMLEGRRKSVEPMAQRLGDVHYQALHHFVATSPWDWRPVRRRLAERLVAALEPTAWAVDDTGFPKDGDHSVGVQRQYCGTLGKTANCQLGVSVNAVTEQASCPLDWRLFLPESWEGDTSRRAACQVPAAVRHRPKWQLALDMVDELEQWGFRPPVLVADAAYGEVGEFRQGLDDRQIQYVVQVKADTSAYPE